MPGRAKKRGVSKDEGGAAESKSPVKKTKPEVYKRRASAVADVLREKYGDVQIDFNPTAPRRGSFEFKLVKDDGKEVIVWTGLKKGPPRKLKFPDDPSLIIKEVEKVL